MSQPTENDSIEAAIRGKLEYDRSTSERIKTADTVVKLVYLLLGIVITGTLGVANNWNRIGKLEEKVAEHDRVFAERKLEMDDLRKTDRDSEKQREKHERELDDIKKLVPDIRDMIFMRDNGISNKEAFSRKHGYRAPGEQDTAERPILHAATPAPRPSPENR